MTRPVRGTEGYAAEAPDLLIRYEEMRFEDAHAGVFDLIPAAPIKVLDIGAGTGRDAAWFAARGDAVTAIEPTREMREGAMMLHPEPNVVWIEDWLPDLPSVRGRLFDLVWMSAVWMHFDEQERAAMMPGVAAHMRPTGSLMISLRHGPVPAGRLMFAVSAAETIAHAKQAGLTCIRDIEVESAAQPGVLWSRLWFRGS
jgi:SAM-dependent methyltransferase